jgi:hypothetical protein
MRTLQTITVFTFFIIALNVKAQNEMPRGYAKGTIVLPDNTSVSGFVKDKMKADASVSLIDENHKKKLYHGSDIRSVSIGEANYICIKGDFFRTICTGKLCFLQKMSDASAKPTYNGTETIFSNGTEGKRGDYFIYNSEDKQLKLVAKKNLNETIVAVFAGDTAALDKAKTVKDDLSQLKDAVEVYNNSHK